MTEPDQNQPGDARDLMLRYLEDTLPADAVTQLSARLRTDPVARHDFALLLLQQVQLTEIGQQQAKPAIAPSRAAEPTLAVAPPRKSLRELLRGFGATFPLKPRFSSYQVAALAACLVLATGIGLWLFGPTVGEPVLAEIQGVGMSLERAGQALPALAGTQLQPDDVLRAPEGVSAVISFKPEKTRIVIQPRTDLRLTETSRGKRFTLQTGKLEASVARQRPFRLMHLKTPQAEARVIGTRFTLAVTTNATRLDVSEGRVRFTRLSDLKAVRVRTGHYAVAAANYELAALPQTGGVLREWWTGVKGKTRFSLSDDLRFPNRPDGRDVAPDFELKVAETNQLAVRIRGYVHPPVTGNYNFWLERPSPDFAAAGFANLTMSPTENPSEAVQIAQTTEGGSLVSRYVAAGSTTAPPPIPLVAGRRYYIEARLIIGRGEGQLSVAWQPPGQSREVLKGQFLSPFKPK